MELAVPEGEYLADDWLAQECPPGEKDETGDSRIYNRFTVKQEAIIGIVLKKSGHDQEFEERQKRTTY